MAAMADINSEETSTDSAAFDVQVIRDRAAIEPIWQRLEAELANGHLATSWDWTSSWLDAYGSAIDHWFIVAESNDQIVGVALMTRGVEQRRGPLPVRTLHIGTAGEIPGEGVWVEYNRLLVLPAFRERFLKRLLTAPGAAFLTGDVLELNGFAPEEVSSEAATAASWSERPCYTAVLNKGTPTIESFDRDTRRKLRNNLKRFAELHGELRTEWITDLPRAFTVFAELIVYHQQRWIAEGKPGAFASERFRTFHDLIIERLLPRQQVILARVTAGDALVGIFYGFAENGVIYHYQWGLPQFDDNKLSPGFVTGYLVMEQAIERGFTELNWLAGDSRYKRELSNTLRSLIWAEYPRSPWMHAVNGLISAKRSLQGRS